MKVGRFSLAIAGALAVLAFATPVHGTVNICWELLEPIWVPPTPLDAAECTERNWYLCAFLGMPHCCLPTCRLQPDCVLGGTFIEGHWNTLECQLMEPQVALEQFLRGFLRPADDFLEPIRQAAVVHINGLMAFGRPIPVHVQGLINGLMGSSLLAGQPRFQPGHVARTLLLPERQPTADLYLPNPAVGAITLDRLVIMRNASFDAIFNEPPRTADDFYCGRASPQFARAVSMLMHELVHVRQWDVLGRDTFLNNYLLDVMIRGYSNDAFESEAFQLSRFVDAQLVSPSRTGSHGWVFSDRGSFTGTRTVATGTVNSAGGVNTVTRDGVGSYHVLFGGLAGAGRGNVQVAAGTANRYCKPTEWGPSGTDLSAGVQCFDPFGNAADSRFFATVQSLDRMCHGTSYFWSDQISGTFEPYPWFSHSQSLTPNKVTRLAPGRYFAWLPGFWAPGGHAQVSAFGSDPVRCQVENWLSGIGRTLAVAWVNCFNPDGTPVDARFSLQFSHSDVIGSLVAIENAGMYLLADQPAATAPYTPTHRYSNREGRVIAESPTVERRSRGRYRAYLPSHAPEVETAALQLSAYGAEDRICSILGRSVVGTDARIDVGCTDAVGQAADSNWALMFSSNAETPM